MPRWTPFEPYFWGKVKKTNTCWIWQGGTYGSGYGRIRRGDISWPAHRVSYELCIGRIPNGMYVCHHCDNKLCVNPKHLFIGTPKDNMQDWTRKGKNRLANDRSLWSNGKHMKRPEIRKRVSASMKSQFSSGRRVVIRDEKSGRVLGTKML